MKYMSKRKTLTMLEKLAIKWGTYVYEHSKYNPISLKKTIFQLHVFFTNASVLLTGFIMSLLLHHVESFLVFYFGFMILRMLSGSLWHLNDSTACYIVSSVLLIVLPMFDYSEYMNQISYLSFVILAILSPILKLKSTMRSKLTLKIITLLCVMINLYYFKSSTLSMAFLIQSMTLIPLTKKGLNKLWRQ
ncbi:accessory gene regulator B family protein [Paenibacillus sp. GCM10027629]|uniref:accessory gene regulator B family protein n=1 Tax=Paenibacillus sp. GCM10027629 TaxID=3273414 RepID=UPI00362D7FB1